MQNTPDDGSKRVKNIAAVLYLFVMVFIVGGSYWHQQSAADAASGVAETASTAAVKIDSTQQN
jgi:hypothetical protein